MKTKSKRLSALLLAFVMVASLFTGQVLPAFADEVEWGWELVPGRRTIYALVSDQGDIDDEAGYFYLEDVRDLYNGKSREAVKSGADFFVHTNRMPFNIYYELSGAAQTIGTGMFSGGQYLDLSGIGPTIPVIQAEDGTFLAGPFEAADGKNFYYMNAPRDGSIQGIIGDNFLQGPETGSRKTDISVFYNAVTGEIIPLSAYIAPGGEVPAIDKPKYPGETGNPDPVASISLDKTAMDLVVGGVTGTLVATVFPNTAPQTVTWTTNRATVATVNGGVVTAIGAGTATITATAGTKTAICIVEVTAPLAEAVSLNKTTLDLTVGNSDTLVATVYPPAASQSVVWSTSDDAVAGVNGGVVTAKSAGTAIIRAVANGKEAACLVTVSANPSQPLGPGPNGDYYESTSTPNVYEVVDEDGNPKTPNKEYIFDVSKDNTPHTGGTLTVVKGVPDGKWYTETPAGIYHEVDGSGNYDTNNGKTAGTDGIIGSSDDKAVTKYGSNWYESVGKNVFKAVTGPNAGTLVGGGFDSNPDTNPAKPIAEKEGKYLVGPMTDSENNTFYYGDPSTGNLDSESNALKGNDVIWYVGEGGGLTQTKPVRPPVVGGGTVDLGGITLPPVTGDTPVSVYNLQLKFIADGYCWQIIAIDKNGNCLITTTDAKKNEQLIQLDENGIFMTTTQRYDALKTTSVYEDTASWGINDYSATVLHGAVSTIYAGLTDLKTIALPAVYGNNDLSLVNTQSAARKYGCFALSLQETMTYFPDYVSRNAKLNDQPKDWWLRSDYAEYYGWAWFIWSGNNYDGGYEDAAAYNTAKGVRPAMWVNFGSTAPVEVPSSSAPTVGMGKIDLAGLNLPRATGTTPLSVWNMQLKFVADGYCWQIIAVDNNGNVLVTSVDVAANTPLIQMNANGGFMVSDKRYFAITSTSKYEASWEAVGDYKTSILAESMGEVYNKLATLRAFNVSAMYSSDGYSVVELTNPARRFGCFALSLTEANNLLPTYGARMAKTNNTVTNWWLRTATYDSPYSVDVEGYAWQYHSPTDALGVRPAMWLNLG